jgi:TolB-like protein/AraC-like DNA-binding protein/Flp pilus assembly protein TadD
MNHCTAQTMETTFLHKAIETIEANMGNSGFSAEEFSRQMGMSHSTLLRKIRRATGKSVSQLIREIRLKKAREMLTNEDISVSETAFRLGFSSPSYFTSCFTDFYGYHPGDLKNRITADQDQKSLEPGQEITSLRNDRKKASHSKRNIRIARLSILGLAVLVTGMLLIPKLMRSSEMVEKSIAVMPFKLLSDEPNNQYLADGMMEFILVHLSRINDLRVRGRTSVEQYRQTTKPIKTIGRELDVKYILEGSFQKYGENVRLIVLLIDAGEGTPVWGNEYNNEWREIFSVQSEVAQDIARKIDVAVKPEEKKAIENPPTTDLTAYDYYLKGIDYTTRSHEEQDMRRAIRMYEKAARIDPDFSLAWVGLAGSYRSLYWWGFETERVFPLAKEYLDKALSLSPELKEVQMEHARYIYHISHDLPKSLEILKNLKSNYPNDAELLLCMSAVYKRMGEYHKALEQTNQAISLEPSNWEYWLEGSILFGHLGLLQKAEEYNLKSFSLNPSNYSTLRDLLEFYFSFGQIQKARELIKTHEKSFDSRDLRWYLARLAYFDRDFDRAIQFTDSLSEDLINKDEDYCTKHLRLGLYYLAKNDSGNAARQFSMERDFLLRKVRETGEDWRLYHSLAIACAGLGLKDQALEAEGKAREIRTLFKDAHAIRTSDWNLIAILVMLGEYDDAMKRLDHYMGKYNSPSVESLKTDPFWDPVRNHPKFKQIINNPRYRAKS